MVGSIKLSDDEQAAIEKKAAADLAKPIAQLAKEISKENDKAILRKIRSGT